MELPGSGGAVLAIAGELPLTLSGGACLAVDGDLYLNIPAAVDAPPPHASLIVWAGDGLIRQGELVWAVSEAVDQSALTTQLEQIEIELHSDGVSGQLYGVARQSIAEQPFSKVINVSGSFTCVSAPVRIAGEYPADLTGAQCSAGPFELRAGSSGQNAVVLVTTGNAQPGSSLAGGMTWRADGRTFITTSLQIRFGTDGVSGTFQGWAIGDGAEEFEVSGSFNCLGG